MYKYKCPNCKRESTSETKLVAKICPCGHEMLLLSEDTQQKLDYIE